MRMCSIVMLITSVRVNPAKLIRMFIGQILKGNKMGPIKIHNGGNYNIKFMYGKKMFCI